MGHLTEIVAEHDSVLNESGMAGGATMTGRIQEEEV